PRASNPQRSPTCDSLFPTKSSLFRAERFAVPCRSGNPSQNLGIAPQKHLSARPKGPKWPEVSKIPCYLPCYQGIALGQCRPLSAAFNPSPFSAIVCTDLDCTVFARLTPWIDG